MRKKQEKKIQEEIKMTCMAKILRNLSSGIQQNDKNLLRFGLYNTDFLQA